jgi:uncharacterized protein (UPF0332 family)
MNISQAVENGILEKVSPDKELAGKETAEADYDLEKAQKALEDEDFKWAIVKSYYSMFHAARAVLFVLGYREKKHFGISVVLDDLCKRGKLESLFANDFKAAVSAREDADYHYIYSEDEAGHMLDVAEQFKERMSKLAGDI